MYLLEYAGGLHCSAGGASTTPSAVLAHPIRTKTLPRVASDAVSLPSAFAEKSTHEPTPLEDEILKSLGPKFPLTQCAHLKKIMQLTLHKAYNPEEGVITISYSIWIYIEIPPNCKRCLSLR